MAKYVDADHLVHILRQELGDEIADGLMPWMKANGHLTTLEKLVGLEEAQKICDEANRSGKPFIFNVPDKN
jgi:hypothetical protein